MKIPSYLSIKIRDAYFDQLSELKHKKTPEKPKTSDTERVKADEIILSSQSAEIRKIEELSKKIPDIRQEKVETIKEQIESKEYSITGALVAKSIINFFR